MGFDKELAIAEKAARRLHPIGFQLFDTLGLLLKAMTVEAFDRARTERASAAFEEAAAFCADAHRAVTDGYRIADVSDEQARAVLESVGLLPVTCQERIGPVSRCSHRGNPCGRHEVRA